ncbi:MAG: ATP-binding cassette domain-containing protein [Brevundimonas sp.]|jgi:osmoprotectant transport system ATP-binding protein
MPPLKGEPAIWLENVSKSFDRGRTLAVERLDLAVQAGEFLVVIGGSGSGKSTTLRMINRLIEPDAGAIMVHGRNVLDCGPEDLRRGIGYVIQGIGLFPHLTVSENITITPKLLGLAKEARRARAHVLLAMTGLDPTEYADRFPSALSGGQRQRVGFARALAAQPKIVLMDEPFGALDPMTRESLAATYRALHTEFSLTTVMVTHDMMEALTLADRIAVMNEGELIACAPPIELLASDQAYVRDLLAAPLQRAERIDALLARAGAVRHG